MPTHVRLVEPVTYSATSCCAIAEERLAYPESVVPPFHCLLVAVYPLFGHVATHVFTAEKVENRENLGH